MKLFPAFLDLAGRSCLVVGAGRVGLDKATSLCAAGASVLVVDPSPSAELRAEADALGIPVEAREFRAEDCRGCVLVFACTGQARVDEAVASAAKAAGALCCRADGARADFTTGATLWRGDLCVSVSSGGASPVLAVEARDRAAAVIGAEFGEAARLLGGLRDRLREGGARRSDVMGGSLVRDVLSALRGGDAAGAEAFVEKACATARGRTDSSEGSCTR